MKGVIPHDFSNDEPLAERILALLDPSRAPSAGTVEALSNVEPSIDTASSGQLETSRYLTSGSSHPEARDSSLPAPTPSAPSTPSNEQTRHEDQAPMNGSSPNEVSPRQITQPIATFGPITPSHDENQSTNPPPESNPQQLWAKIQRERERKEREERERIKARIRDDHVERRRANELRKQSVKDLESPDPIRIGPQGARSSDVRVLVRTFDGSSLRASFPRSARISSQVRGWIDGSVEQKTPYNLKIILTPQPNRVIEAAEEEKSLEDLDMIGSCTLVMVPVQGYVESYAPSSNGILGSAISGGYNFVRGSVGAVLGGVRSVLGFGQVTSESGEHPAANESSSATLSGHVRVRTLADQRLEAQKKDQQFYNGNQLNFQPRMGNDDDDGDGNNNGNGAKED